LRTATFISDSNIQKYQSTYQSTVDDLAAAAMDANEMIDQLRFKLARNNREREESLHNFKFILHSIHGQRSSKFFEGNPTLSQMEVLPSSQSPPIDMGHNIIDVISEFRNGIGMNSIEYYDRITNRKNFLDGNFISKVSIKNRRFDHWRMRLICQQHAVGLKFGVYSQMIRYSSINWELANSIIRGYFDEYKRNQKKTVTVYPFNHQGLLDFAFSAMIAARESEDINSRTSSSSSDDLSAEHISPALRNIYGVENSTDTSSVLSSSSFSDANIAPRSYDELSKKLTAIFTKIKRSG
jgi:hypothetical protein